jgi:hypothetical protein
MPDKTKKPPFVEPSIEEVQAFMKKVMADWPEAFCAYYAEKFWMSYEKSGWRLSAGKGGKMKSWTAAFHSNWKHLDYEQDRKKLDVLKAQEAARQAKLIKRDGLPALTANEIGAEAVDGLMKEYLAHPTHVAKERLAACYEWLKVNLKPRLSKDQTAIVIAMSEHDPAKARATVVGWVFEAVGNKGQSFKQLMQHA